MLREFSVPGERLFLFRDDGTRFGQLGIEFFEIGPFGGQVILVENGFHGAFWHARFAVDAFCWVDVQHLFTLIEAFDGADDDTVGVFAPETGLCNDVSHGRFPPGSRTSETERE
jgi:hypothetical protein